MLEKIKYVNHQNEALGFGGQPLLVNENDLHDFVWNLTSKNDRISSFKRGIVKKTLPVLVKCSTAEEGLKMRNKLFEVCEKDVLLRQYGKIIVGNYYLRCYVTGSKKSDYRIHGSYMRVNLTVQTDLAAWIKERTTVFSANSESEEEFLDYPFDYLFDYKNSLTNSILTNTGLEAANFRITIYGPVVAPTLYIGSHEYTVHVEIGDGEYLTIDSMEKTIFLTKVGGEKVNCLSKRNRDSYIFQKIPTGNSTITSPNGQIYFDITLFDERSEPEWI